MRHFNAAPILIKLPRPLEKSFDLGPEELDAAQGIADGPEGSAQLPVVFHPTLHIVDPFPPWKLPLLELEGFELLRTGIGILSFRSHPRRARRNRNARPCAEPAFFPGESCAGQPRRLAASVGFSIEST